MITGVGFCMYVTRARARPVRPARRGDVRARLRRGGRLLPARVAPRPAPPRRGLHVRVPPRRRVVRRRAARRLDARARRSSTRATRSSGRATRASASTDPLGVSFAALELALRRARRDAAARAAHPAQPARRDRAAPRSTSPRCSRTLEHEFDFSVLYPVRVGLRARHVLERRRPARRARVPAARARPTRSRG